jgi:hypothetical protein
MLLVLEWIGSLLYMKEPQNPYHVEACLVINKSSLSTMWWRLDWPMKVLYLMTDYNSSIQPLTAHESWYVLARCWLQSKNQTKILCFHNRQTLFSGCCTNLPDACNLFKLTSRLLNPTQNLQGMQAPHFSAHEHCPNKRCSLSVILLKTF